MVDFRSDIAGSAGQYSLTNTSEVDPYGDNNYVLTKIDLDVEAITNFHFLFLPFIAKKYVRMNPLFGASFASVGGDEVNRGSKRMMFLGDIGLRIRFGNSEDIMPFLDFRANAGVSRDKLDDGKGFGAETKISFPLALEGRAGVQLWCLGGLCIGPSVSIWQDLSLGGGASHEGTAVLFGIFGGGKPPPLPAEKSCTVCPIEFE